MKCIFALALIVAACSPQTEAANEAPGSNAAAEPSGNNAAAPVADDASAPQPALIPTSFRGLWAEDDSACGQLTHHSRLTITANSVRYPAFVLAVQSVTQPTPNSFAVKGYSKQTKAPTEAHFSLDVTGNILTDEAGGGTVRARCG